MRNTLGQKIADLQRKQRFEQLRTNVKEHISEVKAAMAARDYVEARDCFVAGAKTCQELFDPFPADDPSGRGTHVLAHPFDCCAEEIAP